ncbi:MAG TPA: hypothetical protein VER03_19715, partial [Bryobacteraceae bacterium]|nr:hypothetical protein [Bryobacteraceae bacterium]
MHRRLKHARLYSYSGRSNLLYEILIQAFGVIRTRSAIEAGPHPLATIPVQRELRYNEQRAANVLYATVHFPGLVVKYSKTGDLTCQIPC